MDSHRRLICSRRSRTEALRVPPPPGIDPDIYAWSPRLIGLAQDIESPASIKVRQPCFVRAVTALGNCDFLEVTFANSVEDPNVGARVIHRLCPIGPLSHFRAENVEVA